MHEDIQKQFPHLTEADFEALLTAPAMPTPRGEDGHGRWVKKFHKGQIWRQIWGHPTGLRLPVLSDWRLRAHAQESVLVGYNLRSQYELVYDNQQDPPCLITLPSQVQPKSEPEPERWSLEWWRSLTPDLVLSTYHAEIAFVGSASKYIQALREATALPRPAEVRVGQVWRHLDGLHFVLSLPRTAYPDWECVLDPCDESTAETESEATEPESEPQPEPEPEPVYPRVVWSGNVLSTDVDPCGEIELCRLVETQPGVFAWECFRGVDAMNKSKWSALKQPMALDAAWSVFAKEMLEGRP